MKQWLDSRKPLMIFLGIVYVILALFVVTAFVNNTVTYRKGLYVSSSSGEQLINKYLAEVESGDREAAKKKAIENLDVKVEELPADKRGLGIAFDMFKTNIKEVGSNLLIIFKAPGEYFGAMKNFTIGYLILFVVVIIMKKTNKEYSGIEHGSADWATGGEEYAVLSKTDGFILAKDHFMPMIPNPPSGKNGNILVIRRFWFW